MTALPAHAAVETTLTIGPGSQTLDKGTPFPVRVRLVSGSQQLQGRDVFIYHRPASDQPWQFWHYVVTDSTGYAELPYTANSTQQFTARFRGDDVYDPSGSGNPTYAVRETLGQQLVQEASRHNGAPYQYGAAGPSTFDCSGFTMYVAARFGRHLAHSAAEQYSEVQHLPAGSQRPGDLIFFHNGGGIYHVGFYAGHGKIWAATHSGDYVRLEDIYTSSYYVGHLG